MIWSFSRVLKMYIAIINEQADQSYLCNINQVIVFYNTTDHIYTCIYIYENEKKVA